MAAGGAEGAEGGEGAPAVCMPVMHVLHAEHKLLVASSSPHGVPSAFLFVQDASHAVGIPFVDPLSVTVVTPPVCGDIGEVCHSPARATCATTHWSSMTSA